VNSLAIISLIAGALSFFGHIPIPFVGGGLLALVAIVTGYMARVEIRRNGEQGMWMATLGMVLGIVHFVGLLLLFLVVLFLIFVLGIVVWGHSR
jgi:hypothetical protein